MNFTIESEREDDGRWTAEVPPNHYAPGALAPGATCGQAMIKGEALILPASGFEFLLQRLEHSETGPIPTIPTSIAVSPT